MHYGVYLTDDYIIAWIITGGLFFLTIHVDIVEIVLFIDMCRSLPGFASILAFLMQHLILDLYVRPNYQKRKKAFIWLLIVHGYLFNSLTFRRHPLGLLLATSLHRSNKISPGDLDD